MTCQRRLDDENTVANQPITPQSAATFDWSAVSSFTLSYRLTTNTVTTQAQFYHDGDADFIYNNPVYVSVPRLDLDRNDSTATGNDAHFTFTEDGSPVSIVDSDIVVSNPMDINSIVSGSIVLTNYQAGDTFTIGTLPSNITATIGPVTNGRLTVTLSGLGSESDYAAAFQAIRFSNSSNTPDTTQRIIDISFSNDTLTSAVATSRIDVIPVNDAPIAGNDSATVNEDAQVTIPVLTNDSDPDGDPLTVITASALHGTVTINPNGTLTYRPNANYNGTDTISYTISDGKGGTASATVAVTVTPVNDAPNAVGTLPPRATQDGGSVSYPTASGFNDIDGDVLSYSASGLPAGLAIDAATGLVAGTVNRSASQLNGGSYTVVVTARDPSGATVTQSFTINVTNPGPVATNDSATTAEDTPVTIPVLANDSDPDGDPLTVTGASALHGTVTINANGTLTYRPNANYNGTDTISYTISDGQGGTASATVAVTITPVNDAPAAVGTLPPRSTQDGASVNYRTAGGFTDVDGDTLTYSASGLPAGLAIDATTGLITGTIDRSASQANGGNYTVVITARDPSGTTGTQSFAISVTNPGPIATNDSATTAEDTPVTIPVLTNDSDPDSDPLTVTGASALHGSVTINPDGTLTYRPNANYSGTDTISYTISDGQGGTANATVAVTITPVNDAPASVGTLPPRATQDGAIVNYPTAGGFADVDGDTLTYSASGLPAGLAIDATTGLITGTIDRSASQLNGGNYTVVITARDPSGTTGTQSFAISVSNPGPIATNDSATTTEDTPVTIPVLANDSDPDGDPLSVTSASAQNGTVTINPDGTLTYRPNADYNGTDTISYTISDGQGGTANATVAITITPVNDAPVAVGTLPPQATQDGAGVSYPTAGGFTDVDGDALSYSASGLPSGLAIDTTTGLITGTIDRSASQTNGGNYTVVVTAREPSGATVTQNLTISVTNPGPVATNDSATTTEDTPVTIPVLTNDSDPDGDPLSVISASAQHGTVTINPDGTLTYQPDTDYNGTDTISYTISDGQGGTASATVAIIITPVNDAPVADPIPPMAVVDGQQLDLPLGPRFSDVDGDTLTYSATGLPPGLSIDPATGRITGTIDRTASQASGGVYSSVVTASDGRGGTVSANVSWTVTNPAPVANDDSATTQQGFAIDIPVLGNDSDPDGDALSVVSAQAGRGTVTINPDGTIRYVPAAGFSGTDTIRYTIVDADGAQATATVTVTVAPVNSPPTSTGLPPQINADGAIVSVPVGPSFSDPNGDPLTYSGIGLPPGLSIDPATGVISGTIQPGSANGGPAGDGIYHVIVTVTDPSGATVTTPFDWTVSQLAPRPVNDSVTTAEDTPVTIPVLANDSDPDGDPLTVVAAVATHGTVSINPDGTLLFTPDADYAGPASITYTVSDPSGNRATATVMVTVVPVNDAPDAAPLANEHNLDNDAVSLDVGGFFSDRDGDPLSFSATGLPAGLAIDPATGRISGTIDRAASQAAGGVYRVTVRATDPSGASVSSSFDWAVSNPVPVANDDSAATVAGAAVTIPVLANDSDPDGDPLTVTAASAQNGAVIINPDGTLTYTPATGFSGTDLILYTIDDGNGGRATASVLVTVTLPNDVPVATNDSATTAEDTPVTIPVLANDSDPDGDPLTVVSATAQNGTVTINPDGTLTYVPNADYNGTDTISYTISDGRGGTANATVAVTITPVNDAPVSVGTLSPQAAQDGASVSYPTAGGFSDIDGDTLNYNASGLPAGLAIDPATGVITGTIDRSASQTGNGSYTVVITATDPSGATVTQSFVITIANPGPVAANDSATTTEDTPVTIPVLANDGDPDGDPLTVINASAQHGTVTINPDGTLTYVPNAGYNGTDTISYTVSDGQGGTANAIVALTVGPVNDAPVAVGMLPPQAAQEGASVSYPTAPGFSDPDGDPLTYTAGGLPAGLTIEPATGLITGTIDRSASQTGNGSYTVVVTATDPSGATVTQTFVITIANPGPVAANDSASTTEGRPVTIPVLANDSDSDGDPLSVINASAQHGTVTINPDGTLTYVPNAGYNGTDTISYTISDGQGGTANAIVAITVGPVNDAPVAIGTLPPQAAQEGANVSYPTAPGFGDPNGDPLTYSAGGLPAGLTIDPATGLISGTIDRSASQTGNGSYTVVVTATDPSGATVTQTFVITIANPAPVAANDSATTAENTPVTIPVLANDSDPDGDPLTVVNASAQHGTVTINPDGTLTYQPNAGYNGPDTISYTIIDGQGGTASATVSVAVAANQPPVIGPLEPIPTRGDDPLVIDLGPILSDPDGDPVTIIGVDAPNGTVTINPDGTITYVPPPNYAGSTTIGIIVSDSNGNISTGEIVVIVTPRAAADVEQLLAIGKDALTAFSLPRQTFDPRAAIAPDGAAAPLVLIEAAENIRSLRATAIGTQPIADAVEAIRSLRGTSIDPNAPIGAEIDRLEASLDQRDAGDRMFDQRWSDFMVKGLTGFSVAGDQNVDIMIESVVHGGAIYVEVRDTAGEKERPPIRKIDIRMANGAKLPDWIRVDPRGAAIIERGADMDELHLVVRVTRTDGRTTSTPIMIQGATGEIELDRKHAPSAPPPDGAAQRDTSPHAPNAAIHAEAMRLSASFQ